MFYDEDKLFLQKRLKKIIFITFFLVLLILILMFLIKKDVYYQNVITFTSDTNATLLVHEKFLNNIKEKKQIIIDKIMYDFNIEKIEKNNEMYLVNVRFNYVLKIKGDTFNIWLKKETIGQYILRTIMEDYEKIK